MAAIFYRLKDLLKGTGQIFVGSAAAQAVGIAAMPLVARFYSPEAFGEYAVLFFTSQTLSLLLTLRFDVAIVTAETDEEARALGGLAVALATTIALVLMPILYLSRYSLDRIASASIGASWCAIVPMAYFSALTNVYSSLLLRRQKFYILGVSRLAKNTITALAQLAGGFFWFGHSILLIVGEAVGYAANAWMLDKVRSEDVSTRGKVTIADMLTAGLKNRVFVFANLPHALIGSMSSWLVSSFILGRFSEQAAGAYFLMYRAVMLPASLLGASASQVYFSHAAKRKATHGRFDDVLIAAIVVLGAVGVLSAVVLFYWGPFLFKLVFGPQWELAGQLSSIFAPYVAVHLALSALGNTAIVAGRQPIMLVVAAGQTLVFAGSVLLGSMIYNDLEATLAITVWLSVPYMIGMLIWYVALSRPAGGAGAQ